MFVCSIQLNCSLIAYNRKTIEPGSGEPATGKRRGWGQSKEGGKGNTEESEGQQNVRRRFKCLGAQMLRV